MNCAGCGGACCETLSITTPVVTAAARLWVLLHGVDVERIELGRTLDRRCTALTSVGSCSIYADRPQVCRNYVRGGPACLLTVRRRRSRKQHETAIREAGDPAWEDLERAALSAAGTAHVLGDEI